MTDHDLPSALAALRPPAPSEAAAARALFRAGLALASSRPTPASPDSAPRSPFRRLFPALSASLPLVLSLLLLLPLFRAAPAPRQGTPPTSDSAELLAQLQYLFPGQLDAVIERDGGLKLELSAEPSPAAAPADQALVLELRRGARHLRVLAYSGRPVRLRLDRAELHFLPLLTGDGEVMLSGDDFAWTPSAPAPGALDGWQITARPLAVL